MKKIIIILYVVMAVVLISLGVNYYSNEKWIEKYEEGKFETNQLSFLGFTQPYIAPYNKGNMYYELGEYELAIEQYEKAIQKHPSKRKECDIRINMALAIIAPIDEDIFENGSIENEDDGKSEIDKAIDILERASDVLTKKDCANEKGKGHSKKAQKLYDEIQEMIKKLKEEKEQKKDQLDESSESNTKEDSQEDSSENDEDKDEQDKQTNEEKQDVKDKLKDLQEQATNEHDSAMDEYEEFDNIYDIFNTYDGKSW